MSLGLFGLTTAIITGLFEDGLLPVMPAPKGKELGCWDRNTHTPNN